MGTCLFLLLAACEKPNPSPSSHATAEQSASPATKVAVVAIDPCGLLLVDEVAAVQGTKMQPGKMSSSNEGSFRLAQCFYPAEEPSQSVNLALTQRNPDKPKLSPKEFWHEKFHRTPEADSEPAEEEGEKRSPRLIEGIGDEAYWMGRDALYVLRGDLFFRISIGGRATIDEKIVRAKTLAAKALARLPGH